MKNIVFRKNSVPQPLDELRVQHILANSMTVVSTRHLHANSTYPGVLQ